MHRIIDFHSHVLPSIDDGSKSVEESLNMLLLEKSQGINHVVATPHFYPTRDNPEEFLKHREIAEKKLREAMECKENMPKLSVGAEVYYFKGISDSDVISQLTIDKKCSILIEMPSIPWTDAMYRDLEGLYVKRGLTPIIAHLERYIGAFKNYADVKRLCELPLLIQTNADFFIKSVSNRKALKMLKDEKIHLLGSDCHNLKDRSPNLIQALEVIRKRLGESAFEQINYYQEAALKEL